METTKSQSTYYLDVHSDATHIFKELQAQHNQRAREDGFIYLNNPASIVEMNPDNQLPFVSTVIMPASGLISDLSAANRTLYTTEKNGYEARDREIRVLRSKHLIISNKAIAALTDILHIRCAARQQMESTLLNLVDEPPHDQYLKAKNAFYTEWAPCQPQDAEIHLNVLKTLSARDGRGFARFAIEFAQSTNALTLMKQLPLPTIMMKYLYDATKGVPGTGAHLITMRDGIARDSLADAVQPDVPRWQEFLTSLGNQLKDFPGDDLVKTLVLYVAHTPNVPKDFCIFCGRFGHMLPNCKCKTTGGSCICGAPILPGSTNHGVTDALHVKARETANAKYQAKRAAGGGRGDGGRGGRGDKGGGRDGGRGRGRGRGGGQGAGRGSDAKPAETADAMLAKLIKKQEEQGLALQVLVKSGMDTRKQIEDALDSDIKTSSALLTLEDSTGTPAQSGKRKRT
jgi:uncharacterized membrane protein YgcG